MAVGCAFFRRCVDERTWLRSGSGLFICAHSSHTLKLVHIEFLLNTFLHTDIHATRNCV